MRRSLTTIRTSASQYNVYASKTMESETLSPVEVTPVPLKTRLCPIHTSYLSKINIIL